MARIGILGGTFDPPHRAHFEMASHAIAERGYDKVVFLPCGSPPHKRTATSNIDRYNMLAIMMASDNRYEISTLEFTRPDKRGYTADIIGSLVKAYGEDIEFIIGGDSMRDLHKWYHPERILQSINLLVALRDGDELSVNKAIESWRGTPQKGINVLGYKPQSMSSTRIRVALQLGLDVSNEVSQELLDYIKEYELYSDYKAMREQLAESVSADRYVHSINVATTAVSLMHLAKVDDINQVITAALLHDCAKGSEIYAYPYIPEDSIGTPVAHAFAGTVVAVEKYGINDPIVLDAIYYHTTASANMSQLSKLIYLADMIEPTRDFVGINELRALAHSDFDRAFVTGLNMTYAHLCSQGSDIYHLTEVAYKHYNDI